MKKMQLELGDDDEDGAGVLKINKAYADRYDNWRRLEEIQKLKDRHGDDASSDEESSSSEEPPDWSTEQEKDFLCTLAALKSRDPDIYTEKTFFKAPPLESVATSSKVQVPAKTKDKAMYIKDYERKLVLERGGNIDEDEEGTDEDEHANQPGYYKQQEQIKRELKAALSGSEKADDDGELLKKREKSASELKREEDEWYEWLRGEREKEVKHSKQMKGLRDVWSDSKLNEDEKFLRDFIIERKYDVEGNTAVPTYEDIVGIEEDEEELEKEREFEHKFNFRFEEPDHEFIKQYPRTVSESVRRADDTRKEKRDAHKERKKAEKQAKREEIRELKALKKSEIESKLQRLKRMAKDEELPLTIEDLDNDFDPTAYDKRMQELFNEQYYAKGGEEEEQKPVFSDLSDDDSVQSDFDKFTEIGTVKRGADMVASSGEKEEIEEKEEMFRAKEPSRRNKKRKSQLAEALSKEKPIFDPQEKTFEEYFREFYALDYEDIIGGDTVTRFRYRNVPANSFGLSSQEIFDADDRQLNAWASLKKATAYQTDNEERYDIQAYQKKAQNVRKKEQIFNTDFGGKKSQKLKDEAKNEEETMAPKESEQNETPKESKKKRKRRKKRSKDADTEHPTNNENGNPSSAVNATTSGEIPKKARNRKRRRGGAGVNGVSIPVEDDRLRAYGVNPKKFRNKLKYRNTQS